MDTNNDFPEDKLEVGDEVALKENKGAILRTIIQVRGSYPVYFYRLDGLKGIYTIKDFSFIKRKSDILNEDKELHTSFQEQQIKLLASLTSKKSDPKKLSYTLQNLPVYESTLIPKFGYVLRLPEGYVFANPVTFIPTTTKEIL